MTTQRDVEQLLRQIPLSTPGEVSRATDLLSMAISLRNAAFEGAGVPVPVTAVVGIPGLIDQMRQGQYADAALSLMGMFGDAAGAYSFIVSAGVEMGAFAGTGALASSAVVAGMVAEAAGPAVLGITVLVETLRIPANASENLAKLYYLSDASGILTSWIFDMPEINPHNILMHRARQGGYNRRDISQHCVNAHQRVHQLWNGNYRGDPGAQRAAQASASNNWETYWMNTARALEARLQPFPRRCGIGVSWVRNLIRETNARISRGRRDAETRRRREELRRAEGGVWVRVEVAGGSQEMFIPDR